MIKVELQNDLGGFVAHIDAPMLRMPEAILFSNKVYVAPRTVIERQRVPVIYTEVESWVVPEGPVTPRNVLDQLLP